MVISAPGAEIEMPHMVMVLGATVITPEPELQSDSWKLAVNQIHWPSFQDSFQGRMPLGWGRLQELAVVTQDLQVEGDPPPQKVAEVEPA